MTNCQKWSNLPTLPPKALFYRKTAWLLPVQVCLQSVGVQLEAPAALESSIQQVIACDEQWRRA